MEDSVCFGTPTLAEQERWIQFTDENDDTVQLLDFRQVRSPLAPTTYRDGHTLRANSPCYADTYATTSAFSPLPSTMGRPPSTSRRLAGKNALIDLSSPIKQPSTPLALCITKEALGSENTPPSQGRSQVAVSQSDPDIVKILPNLNIREDPSTHREVQAQVTEHVVIAEDVLVTTDKAAVASPQLKEQHEQEPNRHQEPEPEQPSSLKRKRVKTALTLPRKRTLLSATTTTRPPLTDSGKQLVKPTTLSRNKPSSLISAPAKPSIGKRTLTIRPDHAVSSKSSLPVTVAAAKTVRKPVGKLGSPPGPLPRALTPEQDKLKSSLTSAPMQRQISKPYIAPSPGTIQRTQERLFGSVQTVVEREREKASSPMRPDSALSHASKASASPPHGKTVCPTEDAPTTATTSITAVRKPAASRSLFSSNRNVQKTDTTSTDLAKSSSSRPRSSARRATVTEKTAPVSATGKASIVSDVQPQPQPSTAAASVPAPAKRVQSTAQLTQLTNANTARNKQVYNHLDVVTVYREESRPPSPSAKLRRAVGYGPQSSLGPNTKKGREERAKRRGALRQSCEGFELEEQQQQPSDSVNSIDDSERRHSLAPGDEEGYLSPVKKSAFGNCKFVRWSRKLVNPDNAQDPICEPNKGQAQKPVLVKRAKLDGHGNVAQAKQPLSPLVPRKSVTIVKIVYADDE